MKKRGGRRKLICTRCEGTGFINTHQLPDELTGGTVEDTFKYLNADIKYKVIKDDDWHVMVKKWIEEESDHDVQVCDCCGNGEDWHGVAGEHDHNDYGKDGPYAYNGGRPECY